MKNCGDFVAEISVSGAQTTTAGQPTTQSSCIVPFNGRISSLFARLKIAGTTGTQTCDIFRNGASMTASKTIFGFASTTVVPAYATANLTTTVGNPPLVNKGDVLSIVNTAVHSGTAANDLSVYITIERQRSGAFNDPVQVDTIGTDSDII